MPKIKLKDGRIVEVPTHVQDYLVEQYFKKEDKPMNYKGSIFYPLDIVQWDYEHKPDSPVVTKEGSDQSLLKRAEELGLDTSWYHKSKAERRKK